MPVRYALWLGEVVQGNLGYSYRGRQPVTEMIAERIGPTLRLMATVLVFALAIAMPLGVLSAIKQYSWVDYLATILGFTAISIPSFFLALAAIYLFALKLRWLPTAGMETVGGTPDFGDVLRHLILPALVLGLAEAAPLIRYTRSSMLERSARITSRSPGPRGCASGR